MEKIVEEISQSIKKQAGDNPVLLLISGGVDSTVTAAILLKALKPEQVHLMYMDTGLMRKNETEFVRTNLEKLGAKNLHIIMCENEFLQALKGKDDPEEKRKVIGDLFIEIQGREALRLGLPENYMLAQGTIYTDVIESGQGVKKSYIKGHHNVASPLVDAKRKAGKIIEPFARFYKDDVRKLGLYLGVDETVINRHPFPGPGLAVRILSEVTKEKCDILREADAIFSEELKNRRSPAGKTLYDEIWQAFPVLLSIRSVGVASRSPADKEVPHKDIVHNAVIYNEDTHNDEVYNERKYGWVLALRAITSTDGITANVYPLEIRDLLEISKRITSSVKEIGRVTYDISSKPPATIEWE